ncbi:MAG: HEPN domain-containing protein [Bacteroidia bacterium]
MANKEILIQYWKDGAEESWESAQTLIAGSRYVMALFCWHLCIEKLLKAHWVKDNEDDYPPRIHNLTILHDQTKLNLPEEMQADFRVINFWNIEGRYPDYQNMVYKTATIEYMESKQKMIENIRLCLIEKLQ